MFTHTEQVFPIAVGRAKPARRVAVEAPNWRQAYASRLLATDLVVIIVVVFGSQLVWLGWDSSNLRASPDDHITLALNYTAISAILVAAWMAVLAVFATRADRVFGTGAAEYKLIADATLRLFGLVAIVAFLLRLDLARGFIVTAFPVGLAALIAVRSLWRGWLHRQREKGGYSSQVLLVGSQFSAETIARELGRQRSAGYNVVGACIPGAPERPGMLPESEIPVSANLDNLPSAMEAVGADTLVVTSSEELPPERLRELSWSLEPGRQHLVVAPGLTDIGGPRIHTRPVAGLPLIHVETPRYAGSTRFAKRLFDIGLSGVLIVALSPVLAAVAVIIRLSTPGDVLFRQERIGRNGKPFTMLKFRSMVTDAEAQRTGLRHMDGGAGNRVLFKMQDDPRVTPIGRTLRRYSLDELPQLFNVFHGEMSVVGPRPPLVEEVAEYDSRVHRRFLVNPGMTGLWQVSGRSNLSWEDSVRLDLYYVENWSITADLSILWKTARAVLARDGAY